jgi:hypothetical protein
MDPIAALAMAAGLSLASGIRLYAVVFVCGALHALDIITLPVSLHVLANPVVLTASGSLLVLEFVADKVPGLDSLWDAIHTFIRIPAGALLAVGALGPDGTPAAVAAALFGGALAGSSHFTKAGSRLLINASPEPVSNWAASFGEDGLVAAILLFTLKYPMLLLVLLVAFLALSIWLLPKVLHAIGAVVSRLTGIASARYRS